MGYYNFSETAEDVHQALDQHRIQGTRTSNTWLSNQGNVCQGNEDRLNQCACMCVLSCGLHIYLHVWRTGLGEVRPRRSGHNLATAALPVISYFL